MNPVDLALAACAAVDIASVAVDVARAYRQRRRSR